MFNSRSFLDYAKIMAFFREFDFRTSAKLMFFVGGLKTKQEDTENKEDY
jgi:hypothetical protein